MPGLAQSVVPTYATAPTKQQAVDIGRLNISCPDEPGIVAKIAGLLARHGANILNLDQFTSGVDDGTLYQRTVFHLPGLAAHQAALEADIAAELAGPFQMTWHLANAAKLKRVAIFASKTDHCLLDLLWRHKRGEIPMDIVMVVSNHADLAEAVRPFGIPYFYVPSRTTRRLLKVGIWSCCAAMSISLSWPATCRSFRKTSLKRWERQ